MPELNSPAALIYVRLHASIDTGLGHLFRCLALADELSRRRTSAKFVFSGDEATARKHLTRYDYLIVPKVDELPWLIELVNRERAAAPAHSTVTLLVDHYGIDVQWEAVMADHVDRLVVIDDLADRQHRCDVLVDATWGREASTYARLNRLSCCDYLLGSEYAMLRDQFRLARTTALESRCRPRDPLHVLVCIGGYDPDDKLGAIISSMLSDRMTSAFRYTVVVDKMSPNFEQLASIEAKNVSVVSDVSDMATLMLESDVAIGAGGTMTWERAVVGLPAIVCEAAENQRQIIAALSKKGAIAEVSGAGWLDQIRETLARLRADGAFYRRMSSAAFGLGAGLGSKLVAMRLVSPEAPVLRPATADDVRLLFAWQTETGARRYSRNPDPPSWPEHLDWFKKVNADPRRMLMIISVAGDAVGMLRLDYLGKHSWEVSVLVANARRNKNYAHSALKQADLLYPECTYFASISPDNRASVGLFEKAGYRRCAEPVPITGSAWARYPVGGYAA